jgi:two-component system CheB/CheR fusion protein
MEILDRLSHGEKIEHYETERVTKDGARIHVSLSISPLFDVDGKIIGAATIARDITAQKQGEEVLRKTEKLAAAGRLAATIAHEINNPLEGVTNLLYLLGMNKSLDNKARQHLALAEHELGRVAHMTRQTLGFYRDTLSPVPVNVAQTLDEVVDLYQRKLQASRIEVQKDYANAVEVIAFPGELRQVFSNLIANAIDAMSNGGQLTLRVTPSRNDGVAGVRVTVSDSGSGIRPEHRHKLFEPFYTTKKDVGTGLGLWLSKEIVQKHGGSILFRSSVRPGCAGTVFSVFLPIGAVQSLESRSA